MTNIRADIQRDIAATIRAMPSIEQVVVTGSGGAPDEVFPMVFIGPMSVQWSDTVMGRLAGTGTLLMAVITRDDTHRVDTYTDAIFDLIDEIHLALVADVTRGGYAIDTALVSDDPYPLSVDDPIWGAELTVEVRFRRDWSNAALPL